MWLAERLNSLAWLFMIDEIHMPQADPLLQPFQLKHLTLRNRIISTCHEPAYAEDGKPQLRYQLYHEEKAKGGVAMSMFGGSANIAPDSPSVFGQLYLGDDSIIPYLQQMAERIHRHGAYTICQTTPHGTAHPLEFQTLAARHRAVPGPRTSPSLLS